MLTAEARRRLRAQAHPLKPVILIGQKGASDAVLAEIGRALDDHELIKVRMRGIEREARATELSRVCETLGADLVGCIGAIAILFRPRPEETRVRRKRSIS